MPYQDDAASWKRETPQHLSDFVARPVVYSMLRRIDSRDEVLDAGGGEGYFSRKIAHLCGNVTNVELSGPMVAQAVKQANIRNVQGDVLQLPIRDSTIDVYVSNFVASNLHPEDLLTMYGEISRVLKPEGSFIISIPHPQNFFALQTHSPAITHDDAVLAGFDYNDSRGQRFQTTLGKVDRNVVQVAHVHSRKEDHSEGIELAGLYITSAISPAVSELVAFLHPMFESLEGERPYLVFSGKKSLC